MLSSRKEIASEVLQSSILLTVIFYAIFAGYVPYKQAESHKREVSVADKRRHNFANATYLTVLFWISIVMLIGIQIARVYFNEIFSSKFIYKLASNLSRVLYSVPFFQFIMTDCSETYCVESVSPGYFNADFVAGVVYTIEISVFLICFIFVYGCSKLSDEKCDGCLGCLACFIILLVIGIIVISFALYIVGFAGTTTSIVISSLITAIFIIDLSYHTFLEDEQ